MLTQVTTIYSLAKQGNIAYCLLRFYILILIGHEIGNVVWQLNLTIYKYFAKIAADWTKH